MSISFEKANSVGNAHWDAFHINGSKEKWMEVAVEQHGVFSLVFALPHVARVMYRGNATQKRNTELDPRLYYDTCF